MADDGGKPSPFGEIEEILDKVDTDFNRLKNFEVLDRHPPHDHRCYISRKRPKTDIGFRENIKKEWEILDANLPSSIFVRSYSSRIDVMRACVIGLEGTPYCYGLFFFDIIFPGSYPAKPPEVFYDARGFDLSPDLHKNGRVSLSVLNHENHWYDQIWLGRKETKEPSWNPRESNILQVLLSIQHLVLNPKPCFDGPSCVYLSGERSSLMTMSGVFMASCEAMLQTLGKPLKDFEVLVKGHFRKHAHLILLVFKAQMGKCGDEIAMKNLFFKLVKAFEENGAYCQHHYTKAELEEEYESKEDGSSSSSSKSAVFNAISNVARWFN